MPRPARLFRALLPKALGALCQLLHRLEVRRHILQGVRISAEQAGLERIFRHVGQQPGLSMAA